MLYGNMTADEAHDRDQEDEPCAVHGIRRCTICIDGGDA